MKIARLASLALIASMAMSLVAASMALAEPEFKPATATIAGTSGATLLEADNGVVKILCEKNAFTGSVTSPTLAGHVVVHFLGCTSSGETGSGCTIKSVGASGGLIITSTLHGVLGLSLPKVGTGVALLFLPAAGKIFTTIEGNACTVETDVSGSVAGEMTPIGRSQTVGTIKFALTSGKPAIKGFDPSAGGATTAKLTAFATEAIQSATESVTYSVATEVS